MRQLAPAEMEVVVRDLEDPLTTAWKGGATRPAQESSSSELWHCLRSSKNRNRNRNILLVLTQIRSSNIKCLAEEFCEFAGYADGDLTLSILCNLLQWELAQDQI